MKKNRSTKRALLMSGLALFACISMLVGSTFAWFTDSVTSANNIIKSGNLDITLEYLTGDDWNKDWTDVAGKSDILTNELFEPGVVEVAYLKLANAGSLALKYQLGINIANEIAGINQAGESFNLSDYIYFGVVEVDKAFADRKDAVKALTDAKLIKEGYNKASYLEAKSEPVYLALVVYMPETVGNEANYKTGTNAPQIDLGINVYATQYTSESDSFDKYYDGGAKWTGGEDYSWYDPDATELTIGSAEQLAAFAALVNGTAVAPTTTYSARAADTIQDSFAGQTIKLVSNIDLDGKAWTPIGNWDNAFEGIFDGNGYTISNLAINDPAGEGVGFFGVVAGATIKGLTLKNVDINAYSMVAALVGAAYPATISDCHVTGEIDIVAEWAYVAGIAGYCYYGTQVDGCSTIAEGTGAITSKTRNAVGGITAWLLEGNHNVTDCSVKNLNLTGWTNVGGITGFVHYNNTISGCSVENVNLIKTRVDGNPGIGLIAGGYSYSANNAINLSNNSVKNVTLSGNHVAYSTYNNLYGSEYGGATVANFVLENNTVSGITNDLVEVVKATNNDGLKNALANDAIVVLGNGKFALPTLSGKEGITIIGSDDTVISGGATGFGGNFGKNTTIKNVTFSGTSNGVRWSYAQGGTSTFENCTFAGDSTYGFHIDESKGATFIFNNCTFSGFNAFAGDLVKVEFNNCTFKSNGNYGHTNIWSVAYFNDCTWDKGVTYSGDIYINGAKPVETADKLDAALGNGEEKVVLTGNLSFNASETTANSGYGATGVSVKGSVLDGNGYSLGINNWGTWDAAVHITAGTIKNLTINSGMRGIFMGSATADVYIDNVTIDGTIYTFNSDGGNKNYGVYISNSTLNGWTSHSDVHKEVVYTNCEFGEGQGYAFCRPYGPTSFVGCDFEAGYELEAIGAVTFEDCTIGGVALTAENLATLVIGGIANATVK